ncbi:MAG: ribbon-helix-helix protein, CopG family [Actinomycetes bacterium]|jgi:predicted transcriptional regulator
MAMTLRLSEEETEALRAKAEAENRSMQDVARIAIDRYVTDRQGRLRQAIEMIASQDAELLDRLSK